MSFMKVRNNKGPRTAPCGTPEHTGNGSLASWFTTNLCSRFVRKDFIHLLVTSKIPVRWPGQCYGFTLSLIFKYCGGIGLY